MTQPHPATNLTLQILVGMVAGFLVGVLLQWAELPKEHLFQRFFVAGVLDIGGRIFINSLMLLVVPLVLVSLICGASNLGDGTSLGRVGGKTIALYLITTAVAISLALLVALLVSPGVGVEMATPVDFTAPTPPPLQDVLVNIFPRNPVAAMAEGNMLQIIVFALLFGIALAQVGAAGKPVKALFESANAVLLRLVMMLIRLAPIGVFCLMASLFTQIAWDAIAHLGKYFATVVCVLALHVFVVYPTLLSLLARLNPLRFLLKMREPLMLAFSTASSGATMPVTLRTVEQRIGVRNEVAAFSIPLGTTINMDGTAIMQGVATVFIAQFFGVELGLQAYLLVILTATLASIGTAAVPGVGLVMLSMVLTQVGLPVEGIMLVMGVDRLLDMLRTAVNVTGDATVATIVARSENQFDDAIFAADAPVVPPAPAA